MTAQTLDRLSTLLERFRVRATFSHTGPLCGLRRFDAAAGRGHLHVLRRGELLVSHASDSGAPARLQLTGPAMLFYPRPLTHCFHNPPAEGPDFTCAELDFDGGAEHPLARCLPPLLALPLDRIDGLDQALQLLFAEAEQLRCGQRLLADRLFEVVLIQLLRWLLDHPAEAGVAPGLIAGLSEPRLARALVAMHESPSANWTLAGLARCAGMSRTAFAATFKNVLGQSPMDYLADWRIALVQTALRQGRPLKLLAEEVGYSAPAALTRLFSARVGCSPREWVKRQDGYQG
jgi:AraC-like DNA-binding protein